MSGDISQFLKEQRLYILEEKRRLGILENTQCAKDEVGIRNLIYFVNFESFVLSLILNCYKAIMYFCQETFSVFHKEIDVTKH